MTKEERGKGEPVEVTTRANDGTVAVYKKYKDGSEEIHVEGPFHVDNRRPREQDPTTF